MRPRRGFRRVQPLEAARWIVLLILLIAAALLGRNLPMDDAEMPAGGVIAGRASVIDGDSLTIGGARIRLKGIDAPEGPQTCRRDGRDWSCGEESRRHLANLIGVESVSCRARERDKHQRALAVCATKAHELNAGMVAAGYAVSFGGAYRQEEMKARARRLGLWSGEFENPRTWRRERGIGE